MGACMLSCSVVCNFLWSCAAAAKSLQSCPTLCDPRDGSPPGSPVPGILQVRTLEWVAISFSNAWKWRVKVKSLSRVWLFATPWTAAYRLLHPWDFLLSNRVFRLLVLLSGVFSASVSVHLLHSLAPSCGRILELLCLVLKTRQAGCWTSHFQKVAL